MFLIMQTVALVFAGIFKIEIEDFFWGGETMTKQNKFLNQKIT